MNRVSVLAAVLALACADPVAEPTDEPMVPPVEVPGDAGAIDWPEPAEPEPAPAPRPAPIAVRADVPPIAGGTMVVTADGVAVAGDELTDQLWVLDLDAWTLLGAIDLEPGAMPGRAVADAGGFVHVVTRRGGELLRVDPRALRITTRRSVCGAPRGVAWDGSQVHVACAGGELVSFEPDGGGPVRTLMLEPDLRDVVALGGRLYVSRFRSAELLVLDATGAIVARGRPSSGSFPQETTTIETEPRVAWRLFASGDRLAMVHQQAISSELGTVTTARSGSPYDIRGSSGPGRIVEPHVTTFGTDARPLETSTLAGALVVDAAVVNGALVAASPENGGAVAVVSVGDGSLLTFVQDSELLFERFWPRLRTTWTLVRPQPLILSEGREVFHRVVGAGIACASCHPEAHEDGHVWIVDDTGARRSQSLLGGLIGTEPFHWNGDLASFEHLMEAQSMRLLTSFTEVEQARMLEWLDRQPTVAASAAPTDGGRAAFETAGCADCHSGDRHGDELAHDVGAGPFQTPRLTGVNLRAPYFVEGCASTLEATLDGTCRPLEQHGVADPTQRARVVEYLRAL